MQKSLFLLEKLSGAHLQNFYDFTPYHYGPFDSAVYQDAAQLSEEGLVMVQPAPGQRWNEFIATHLGLERAKEVEREVPFRVRELLKLIVAWAREHSFEEIVRAIYKRFPEFRTRSVFRD
jgi:uncharacterized protein YwgA